MLEEKLSAMEMAARIHDETGVWVNSATIVQWTKRGLCGIALPHERIGAAVFVKWSDYKKWQARVNKAKQGRRGRRSVIEAA